VEDIKKVADYVSQLRRVGKGHGELSAQSAPLVLQEQQQLPVLAGWRRRLGLLVLCLP
jgi:hypothetical protein